jgi:hypothetical protein
MKLYYWFNVSKTWTLCDYENNFIADSQSVTFPNEETILELGRLFDWNLIKL